MSFKFLISYFLSSIYAASVFSFSYSPVPVDIIVILFSGIPSIPNTEHLYPELIRSSELSNAMRA